MSDNGTDEETRTQVFDPFFVTKDMDSGTGLGLSRGYGIAQQRGGWVEWREAAGRRCRVLGVYPGGCGQVVEMAVQTNGEVPSGVETMLLFNDEEHIRTSMKRLLELSGYDVLLGCDGLQALDIYKKHQGKIGVVILDISMPKMSGREASAEL